MNETLDNIIIFERDDMNPVVKNFYLPNMDYFEVYIEHRSSHRMFLITGAEPDDMSITDQVLKELFGKDNIFHNDPYDHKDHNKSVSSGYIKLFKHLDIEYPHRKNRDHGFDYSALVEHSVPEFWTLAKSKLKGYGMQFASEIVEYKKENL